MRGPRVAVALGAVLLLLGFATGTWASSASVDGVSITCAPALDLTRLPFNDSGAGPAPSPRTPDAGSRGSDSACRSATLPLRLVTWTALAVGGLVCLAGWTALREQRAGPRACGGASGLPV